MDKQAGEDAILAANLADPKYPQVFKDYEPKVLKDCYLEVVPRDKWGAVPATSRDFMCTPAETVVLLDTGGDTCDSAETCQATLQALQKYCMQDKGLSDIPWNFMIGGDGRAYEGRGWTNKSNKLVSKYDQLDGLSMDIAYIGDYSDIIPHIGMSDAALSLCKYGVKHKYLSKYYQVINGIHEQHVE